MHFDGSKMKNGLGAGIVLTSPKGDRLHYVLQIHFAASNNVPEHEALVHGIKLAKEIDIRNIECFGDSDLVVQQCTGNWDAKDANIASYRFLVQQLSGYFEGCEFHHVPRANNEAADALSKLGSTRQAIPPGVSLEHIKKPSITPSPDSESIFISETDLEALRKASEVQPAKPATTKKQSSAQGVSATAPGAADCEPGAAEEKKKSNTKEKQAVAASDSTTLGEQMTSEIADGSDEAPTPDEKSAPGAAECVPGAAVGSSQAKEMADVQEAEIEQANVQETEIQEEVLPQQAAVMVVVSAPSWAQPIRDFLEDGTLTPDLALSRQISRQSLAYTIINNELMRKSPTGVLQRCVEDDRGLELLRDIHQGECGHHASAKAIANKAFRHGFY